MMASLRLASVSSWTTLGIIVKSKLSKQFDYTCDVRGKVRQEGRHRGKLNTDERGRDT